MADNSSSKGNGASKRMSNPNYKARRKQCYLNGEARKAARVTAQHARETANRQALADDPTYLKPWERVKLARKIRRQAERTAREGISKVAKAGVERGTLLFKGSETMAERIAGVVYRLVNGKAVKVSPAVAKRFVPAS